MITPPPQKKKTNKKKTALGLIPNFKFQPGFSDKSSLSQIGNYIEKDSAWAENPSLVWKTSVKNLGNKLASATKAGLKFVM